MKLKTLITLAVAGAFAVPFAAQASADGDRMILAQSGGPAGASSTGTGPSGGVPSPRTAGEPKAPAAGGGAAAGATGTYHSLDTNRDGYVSREEAARESGMNFSELDKDNDGRLSASEMQGWKGSASGATTGASGSSTTGATAGPGSASNRTGPGSDTATTPSTSGQGKAQ